MTVGPDTVSVVIPTHNRAALLPRAIGSVLAQSYGDLELIVVDDASTDDTERVVAGFDDPRVRYVRHDGTRGAAVARNTGIRAARGPLIAFQDSDDEWLPEKLDKQMRVLRGAEADIVYCGFLRHDGRVERYIPEPHVKVRQGDILLQLLHGNFVSTQTLLVRRGCLEKAGLFDERLRRFQDWELAIRLAQTADFRLVDEPLVIVHATPGNISSNAAAGAAALELILQKHHATIVRHPALLAEQLYHLGNLKCVSGASTEARGHFRRALKLRPRMAKAWAALFLALFGSRVYGHGAKARQRVRQGIRPTHSP